MKKSRRFTLFVILAFLLIATPSINAGWLQEDVPVCTDKTVQQGAAISPDGTGGTIVAWEDARNADVYAQRYDASGQELWAPNGVDVSDMAGTQKLPRIVADGAGGAFIAFESDTSTGMRCPEGAWYSVIVVAKLAPNGTVDWKKRVSDAASTSFYIEAREMVPLACADGHGGAIVAWTKDHDLYIDVISCDPPDCCYWMSTNNYAQRMDAEGNLLWGSTPVSVCANDKFPEDLTMAVDSSGATYLAWWDEKPINSSSALFAQKVDIDGTVLWGPNGTTVAPGTSWQSTHSITSGGNGGAIIAWLDIAYSSGSYIYGVHAQRLDSLGGALWASGGTLVSLSSMEITGTAIVPSGPGGSIVAWTEKASGIPTLFAQRLDAGGNTKWQPNGLMISDGINTCANARVAPDGERGAVLAWEQTPVEAGLSLRSIWGFSSFDIYSVGDRGMILHYNGTAWSKMVSGTTADLYGVWGSAGDNVYAVGTGGLILHYDGFSWSPMASGVTKNLTGVWGSSADTIYAVGAGSAILRCDGMAWTTMNAPTSAGANLWGVHGSGANYAYAVGTSSGNPAGIGVLLEYRGAKWHCVYCAYGNYYGVWVSPDSCVYASGISFDYLYGFLVRYDGTNWTNTSLPIRCIGYGMWGDRSDNVYAVFDQGYIAHFDGAQWTLSSATTNLLLDVWGTSGDDIWVVGSHYLIRHFENGGWVTQYQASNNVMVQRLDTLGTKMWTESGAPASVDIDAQRAPSLAYGPPSVALLAWSDNRNGNWDIFARKVSISRGPIVATELMSFNAGPFDDGVKVAWQLSQYTEGAPFTVSRADGGQDADWRVITPGIARDRLSFSFVDGAVEAGLSYRYRVQVSDERGSRVLFETERIVIPALPLTLRQNFPNPFNPSTTIRYYVPGKCRVRLEVYDVSGRLVARLVDRDQPAGHYGVEWNGRDNLGRQVTSGIYFCRLQAGKDVRSRKMVLTR